MGRLIALLKTVDRALAGAEIAVALVAMAGMLLLVAAQVPLRMVPLDLRRAVIDDYTWMGQLARFLLLWAALAGASLATRVRRHIVVDIVTKSLPKRAAVSLNVAASLAAAALSGFICYVGAYVVRENWDANTVLRGLKKGPAEIIIPIAFGVIAFRFLIVAIEDARGAATGDLRYLKAYEQHPGQELRAHHGERPTSREEEGDAPAAPTPPPPSPPAPPQDPRS